jgi:hypothetical protein
MSGKALTMFLRVSMLLNKCRRSYAALHVDHMEVFSVAYVSGSIAIQVVHGVNCDARRKCLIFVLRSTSVAIYFKEYSDTEQPLTYPSGMLVRLLVLL